MDIDFVILWVDDKDPLWLKNKNRYATTSVYQKEDDANDDCRYRGNEELLRFWFRGVENNASWVHRIFFVSSGQIPSWLVTNHPSLVIANHKDFIPEEYLPTFNARPIQFNLHRIRDLSEHFVLFDDDVFILNKLLPNDFFHDGEPVLHTYLGYMNNGNDNWNRVLWNDYGLINTHFNIGLSVWENRHKWFNIKELGVSYAVYNYCCFKINKTLPVYTYGHLAYPHLKSTIAEIWDAFPGEARNTCNHKFRTDDQLSHYLFSAWNQASGRFFPRSINKSLGRFFSLTPDSLQDICETIENKSFPLICLNDSSNNSDFENENKRIIDSFVKCFPEKSSFEK